MKKRIGFACKYMHPDQTLSKKLLEEEQRPYNTKATTRTWLNRQTVDDAEERLWQIIIHNIKSIYHLINYVSTLPEPLRMVRLGSDILPAYTEPKWKNFYTPDVRDYCDKHLLVAGDLARKKDVKLSMHPGPFTVLASDNDDIVERSIEEFEYHVDIARWMGYGKQFQDFKINVHISGRRGAEGIKAVLPRLSPEARNTITIENDEMSHGIEDSLKLEKDLALVLDVHHHWVRTGEYISPTDDRSKRIVDSWRGVRPTIHYSLSRHDLLVGHSDTVMPDMDRLLATGYKKAKLRAHSDLAWNKACNKYVLEFLETSDIMVEAKHKNIASIQLFKQSNLYDADLHSNI